MEIYELKKLLTWAWDKDTCAPGQREAWTDKNPTLGQCAVTALIVKDLYDGKIMRCMTSSGSHYYNVIDGEIYDLTVEQFQGKIPDYRNGEERTREYLLSNEDTKKRYLLLSSNLGKIIEEENTIRKNRFQKCVEQRTDYIDGEYLAKRKMKSRYYRKGE